MGRGRTLALWGGAAVVIIAIIAVAVVKWKWPPQEIETVVTGAVLAADPDLHNQRPIADATIRVVAGASSGQTTSDASGLFRLALQPAVSPDQRMTITASHPEYHSLETASTAGDRLQLLRMTPTGESSTEANVEGPTVTIANIRVRYALKASSTLEIGSAARTFDIVNTANTPCNNLPPCSPDGKWKATVGAFSLDAGENKVFRNARVSCLAGPCPFTRIETDAFSRGGRVIGVSVLNWADTVTYLVEAEVEQTMVSDLVRHSYPVIFGRSMNFTLPPAATGPSIEAELNGTAIVFPLGPKLILSWASCRVEVSTERTRLYGCELKPRYQFK